MREPAKSAKDLKVYQAACTLAMEIFKLSKTWRAEERYSLTDQIRRSSRSVCSNLREAWLRPVGVGVATHRRGSAP